MRICCARMRACSSYTARRQPPFRRRVEPAYWWHALAPSVEWRTCRVPPCGRVVRRCRTSTRTPRRLLSATRTKPPRSTPCSARGSAPQICRSPERPAALARPTVCPRCGATLSGARRVRPEGRRRGERASCNGRSLCCRVLNRRSLSLPCITWTHVYPAGHPARRLPRSTRLHRRQEP
jgi:hypothetical protein